MHMPYNGNTQYHLIANIKVMCTYKLIDVIKKKEKKEKKKRKIAKKMVNLGRELKPCKGFCTCEE